MKNLNKTERLEMNAAKKLEIAEHVVELAIKERELAAAAWCVASAATATLKISQSRANKSNRR